MGVHRASHSPSSWRSQSAGVPRARSPPSPELLLRGRLIAPLEAVPNGAASAIDQ
eukprot:gene11828-10229_t